MCWVGYLMGVLRFCWLYMFSKKNWTIFLIRLIREGLFVQTHHWGPTVSKYTLKYWLLTHWGRVMYICISKLTIIGSDNGMSSGRRQAIIWTNAGILLIGPLGTNFNEMLIEIHAFSFTKIHLKMSSGKWRPFCLGLNVLKNAQGLMGYMMILDGLIYALQPRDTT